MGKKSGNRTNVHLEGLPDLKGVYCSNNTPSVELKVKKEPEFASRAPTGLPVFDFYDTTEVPLTKLEVVKIKDE